MDCFGGFPSMRLILLERMDDISDFSLILLIIIEILAG